MVYRASGLSESVAPLVGARIEIRPAIRLDASVLVAPLVGARIEIKETGVSTATLTSLPSWERGLKYISSFYPIRP